MTSVVGVKFNIPRDGEQDVRNFVRPAPLPLQSHVGVKMRARTALLYDPSEPTRDQVRHQNYSRRYRQLSSQGFRTPAWKPYECIGEEVCLDDRQLILSTLGQKEPERPQPPEPDEPKSEDKVAKHVNPSLFIASRKHVKVDLKAELQKSESVHKHMNIGKSYFEYLQQEKEKRVAEKIRQDQLERQRARTEARPPPEVDESTEDEDKEDFVAVNSVHVACFGSAAPESSQSSRQNRQDCRRKKRTRPPRPYTPLHANIGEHPDEPAWCSTHEDAAEQPEFIESLFKQLCALHWLLEAMLLEDPTLMNPISSSWSLKNIGGTWVSAKDREKSTAVKKEWDSLVSGRGRHRIGGLAARRSTRIWSSMRTDLTNRSSRSRASTVGSTIGSGADGGGSESRATSRASSVSAEESQVETRRSSVEAEQQSQEYRGGIWNKLITMSTLMKMTGQSSASRLDDESATSGDPSDRTGKQLASGDSAADDDAASQQADEKPPTQHRPQQQQRQPRLTRKELAEAAREIGDSLDKEQSVYAEWKGFRSAIKRSGQRPASAPVTVDRSGFLSAKKANLVADMRVQLALRRQERDMELRDRLLHMQRHSERVSRLKYSAIPVGAAPHRAVAAVRAAAGYAEEQSVSQARGRMRRLSVVAAWYDALMRSVPDEAVESRKMKTITEKLYVMATTASSRHTLLQFFRVLETLKDWELCSPHVCAAVEFVRTRVLDIGEEEFEKWFAQSFPMVTRAVGTAAASASQDQAAAAAPGTQQQQQQQAVSGSEAPVVPSALKKPPLPPPQQPQQQPPPQQADSPQQAAVAAKTGLRKQRPLTAI